MRPPCELVQRDYLPTLRTALAKKLSDEGKKPYIIPYGGSNPIGAAAYVLAVKELLNQIGPQGVMEAQPDWIVFPSSSSGTQAGLVLGAKIFGYQGKILGISVDEKAEVLKKRVTELANLTAEFLGETVNINYGEVLVNDEYLGEGYGIPGDLEIEAIRLFSRSEGLLLDPVYTSRAAGGMLDLFRKEYFEAVGGANCSVLFWHTGGTPALLVNKYMRLLAD